MSRERLRYLEAMAIYCEAIAMVEDYQQAVSVANLGGIRDVHGLYPQLGLKNSPQISNSCGVLLGLIQLIIYTFLYFRQTPKEEVEAAKKPAELQLSQQPLEIV